MVRVAVEPQRLAVLGRRVVGLAAGDLAQEGQRRGRDAGAADRAGLAEQDLGRRVDRLDALVGADVELAVLLGRADVRVEPARVVGLVPDRVAVDTALEVLGGGAGELREQPRVGLEVGRLAVAGAGPGRDRAEQRELDAQAVGGALVDGTVDVAPVVRHRAGHTAVVGAVADDAGPAEVDAQARGAELAGEVVADRRAEQVLLDEDLVVLQADLQRLALGALGCGACGSRDRKGEREHGDYEQRGATHRRQCRNNTGPSRGVAALCRRFLA